MKVNGNERAVPAEGTVLALLKELGHDPQREGFEFFDKLFHFYVPLSYLYYQFTRFP